jgi:hypothetical protein
VDELGVAAAETREGDGGMARGERRGGKRRRGGSDAHVPEQQAAREQRAQDKMRRPGHKQGGSEPRLAAQEMQRTIQKTVQTPKSDNTLFQER